MTAKKRGRKFLRLIGKIFLGLLILLLGLVFYGLIREARLRNEYRAEYPAPGKLVTINGHDIHLSLLFDRDALLCFGPQYPRR